MFGKIINVMQNKKNCVKKNV